MGKERASLGFGDELDSFDPAQWAPKSSPREDQAVTPETARLAADATGFKSREPQAPPAQHPPSEPPRTQRRRRTGRNVQLNIKVRKETLEDFYAIADAQEWGLGETLEHALVLLEAKYGGAGDS